MVQMRAYAEIVDKSGDEETQNAWPVVSLNLSILAASVNILQIVLTLID